MPGYDNVAVILNSATAHKVKFRLVKYFEMVITICYEATLKCLRQNNKMHFQECLTDQLSYKLRILGKLVQLHQKHAT